MNEEYENQHINTEHDEAILEHEISILQAENNMIEEAISKQQAEQILEEEIKKKYKEALAQALNLTIEDTSSLAIEDTHAHVTFRSKITGQSYSLSHEEHGAMKDKLFNTHDHLIRTSDQIAPYSPLNAEQSLEHFVIPEGKRSIISRLFKLKPEQQYYDDAEKIIYENTPYNTRLAYHGDVVYWVAWHRAKDRSFYRPFSVDEVCEFIIDHAENMDPEVDRRLVDMGYKKVIGSHKLATIKRRLASLSVFYDAQRWPNPTRDRKVNQLLKALTKKYGGSKPAGRAITLDILNLMLDTCETNKMNDIRDKALLLFGWSSGGRRRSEIADAVIENLQANPDGSYVYIMSKSKTDQQGHGHVVPVNGRAAQALKHWLDITGLKTGAIFRSISKGNTFNGKPLSGTDVNRIVKKRLHMAGLDASLYSAHSLRSGFVTEAGRRNKPTGDVMALTAHKSITTFMRYYQVGNVKNNAAASLADE